ncbi:sensor histidine kinase [Amycolatopsis sp. cg13]|uniref:sensor histidine kinase n=1 Tax=Amycolatopsis sp. cg13 TaxID=3238807 RepID=UPI0035251570
MRWSVNRLPGWARNEAWVPLAVVATTVIGTVIIAADSPPGRLPAGVGYLLLIAGSMLLVFRQRAPVLTVAVVLACSLAYQALNYPGGASTIPPAIALYNAVSTGRRITAVIGSVVYLAGTFALGDLWDRAPSTQGTVWFVAWLVVIVVIGEVARNRREHFAAVRARAEEAERVREEAERTREEEARRRVNEERLRIARELHDVLAHSISMINLQAGVAAHLLDRNPEQARTALVAIKQASKEVLIELRDTLGMLRQVDEEEYPLAPAPGLARLDELVERANATGLDVKVTLCGDEKELPPNTDLAVYRIVQESLTNVIRHARAERAQVLLSFSERDLVVEIKDNGSGSGPASPGLGNGLLGMRERARAAGGELTAGPGAEGGFLVHARLPVRSAL